MLDFVFRDHKKKRRYLRSFWARKLVHTNLQLLYRCNFRCEICDYWKPEYRDRPRLTAAQVRVIAKQLARIGPQIISIGGGEPLLHPEIVDVVRILGEAHFPVMICNGWCVTEELARRLWQAGMCEISVSVDYVDPAQHDAQRGVDGAHARAIAALGMLHRTRVHEEQRVHMISVVMDDNVDDIEPLIRLSKHLGVTYLVTLYSDGRGIKERRPLPRDVSAHLLALKRRYPEHFVVLRGYISRFSRAIAEHGIEGCRTGQNLCNIDSQGSVSLCIDRLDDPVGNILVDDIYQLEARLRAKQQQNSCRDCWTSCRGAVETLMYGGQVAANLWDYYQLTKPVALTAP